MPKRVEYLRSRSLPLLALVEAARIVLGTAGKRVQMPKVSTRREPFGKSEQLRLEGMR